MHIWIWAKVGWNFSVSSVGVLRCPCRRGLAFLCHSLLVGGVLVVLGSLLSPIDQIVWQQTNAYSLLALVLHTQLAKTVRWRLLLSLLGPLLAPGWTILCVVLIHHGDLLVESDALGLLFSPVIGRGFLHAGCSLPIWLRILGLWVLRLGAIGVLSQVVFPSFHIWNPLVVF